MAIDDYVAQAQDPFEEIVIKDTNKQNKEVFYLTLNAVLAGITSTAVYVGIETFEKVEYMVNLTEQLLNYLL